MSDAKPGAQPAPDKDAPEPHHKAAKGQKDAGEIVESTMGLAIPGIIADIADGDR